MGYAHHWSRAVELPGESFAAWADDVRRVIRTTSISIRGPWGEGDPIIGSDQVAFNGDDALFETDTRPEDQEWILREGRTPASAGASQAREAFVMEQRATRGYHSDDDWWGALGWVGGGCKTSGKSYDVVVTASLSLFAHHFPRLCEVTSEGKASEWRDGIALAAEATGLQLRIPSYRHYWNEVEEYEASAFAAWSADVARVITATDVPLAGPNREGSPIVTPAYVAFNGVGDDAYAPFELAQHRNTHWLCHTGQRPYDAVVTAVLVLLAHHLPTSLFPYMMWDNVEPAFESDGAAIDWEPGLHLAQNATNRTLHIPLIT